MNEIRLGFLGASRLSGSHMKAFSLMDSVKISAVADPDEAARERLMQEYRVERGYRDYNQMLQKERLDAAVIVLPTALHKEATLACVESGLHVLCEKPPATNVAEMDEIAQVVRGSSQTYMFCRQSRFDPLVRASRDLILSGKLGGICGSQAHWIRSRGRQLGSQGWRVDRSQGGGVLLDLGIHGLDTIWFCMGCPRVTEVSAAEFSVFKEFSPSPERYTADDGAAGWMRFENGAILQYKFAFGMNVAGPWLVGTDQNLDRAKEWQSYRIYGTQGGLDIFANELLAGSPDKLLVTKIVSEYKAINCIALQAEEFVRAILSGTEPLNSLDHAVSLMRILSALRESSNLGRAISLC